MPVRTGSAAASIGPVDRNSEGSALAAIDSTRVHLALPRVPSSGATGHRDQTRIDAAQEGGVEIQSWRVAQQRACARGGSLLSQRHGDRPRAAVEFGQGQ